MILTHHISVVYQSCTAIEAIRIHQHCHPRILIDAGFCAAYDFIGARLATSTFRAFCWRLKWRRSGCRRNSKNKLKPLEEWILFTLLPSLAPLIEHRNIYIWVN